MNLTDNGIFLEDIQKKISERVQNCTVHVFLEGYLVKVVLVDGKIYVESLSSERAFTEIFYIDNIVKKMVYMLARKRYEKNL